MKKILIVDDSPFIRMVLKDIVSKAYRDSSKIIEADCGLEAIKQIKKEVPELVLLDIIMPEGEEEGITILKMINKDYPKAKAIMITAVGHDAMIERCKKLGVEDYIVKPFDEKEITETLKKYI